MPNNISIVFHSGYGHTEKVADHIATGVKTAGANVNLIKINANGNLPESDWETLDRSDAIIMGSPTYMGAASWQFKKFSDDSSKRWFSRKWMNKIAAGFTNSGGYSGDKLSTLHQINVLAMQHGMIWVGNGELNNHDECSNTIPEDTINRLSSFVGLMTQANPKCGPDVSPPSGDLKTAELFGQRVAEITSKYESANVYSY